MRTLYIRKLQENKTAGSFFLNIPPKIVRGLGLSKGAQVGVEIRENQIIMKEVKP